MKNKLILLFVLLLNANIIISENIKDSTWILSASNYDEEYVGAPISNGMIGILPWKQPFSIKHVILNHVFEKSPKDGINCVIKGLCPFGIKMFINGQLIQDKDCSSWSQTIDMHKCEHTTSFIVQDVAKIRYSYIPLRNLPFCIFLKVEIEPLKDIEIGFNNDMIVPEEYINIKRFNHSFSADGCQMLIQTTVAKTLFGKYDVSSCASFTAFDNNFHLSETINGLSLTGNLKKGNKTEFFIPASICTSYDFQDPTNEAERLIVYVNRLSPNKIIAKHYDEWNKIWESDIVIEGDIEAQKEIRFALFNLYCSVLENSRLSISPMGLSSQGYSGHIFWDSELWMFPPLLLMNHNLAKNLIDYRIDRLNAAKKNALAMGYKGAMYPWESDSDGNESTPTWAMTGSLEHHITADIAIALWKYYCVTKDKEWLNNEAWPVLKNISDFWESRVTLNDDDTYSINSVIGADEYALNVNDNAFTNASVKVALQNSCKAANLCGYKNILQWKNIATNLRILKWQNDIIKEHEKYNGEIIKQADVNLLAYPLNVVINREQIIKNLKYYEDKIDSINGPAMSYSILCIQYARLGNQDKAEELFKKSYRPNIRKPFGVLSETPTSNNPYFITGAGGLLQCVLNGFGGLEITDKGIKQLPSVLPKSWKRLIIKGVGVDKKTYTVNN